MKQYFVSITQSELLNLIINLCKDTFFSPGKILQIWLAMSLIISLLRYFLSCKIKCTKSSLNSSVKCRFVSKKLVILDDCSPPSLRVTLTFTLSVKLSDSGFNYICRIKTMRCHLCKKLNRRTNSFLHLMWQCLKTSKFPRLSSPFLIRES